MNKKNIITVFIRLLVIINLYIIINGCDDKTNFDTLKVLTNPVSINSDNSNLENNQNYKKVKINGFIQKGPFISGSEIIIQELDDLLYSIGRLHHTTTNDDFGSFFLNCLLDQNTKFIEIIAQGYYFNEVSGQLSDGPINLRSIININSIHDIDININVLTNLAYERIKYIYKETINIYEDPLNCFINAKHQAEKEILLIFEEQIKTLKNVLNIPHSYSNDSLEFENLDMKPSVNTDTNNYELNDNNLQLLIISALLQANNNTAVLSEFINYIQIDIKNFGKISNQALQDLINMNEYDLQFDANFYDTVSISKTFENLINRYQSLSQKSFSFIEKELFKKLKNPSLDGSFDYQQIIYASAGIQRIDDYKTPDSQDYLTPRKDISLFMKEIDCLRSEDTNCYSTWGFEPENVPLNGKLFLPKGEGNFPIAFIIHGNHYLIEKSDYDNQYEINQSEDGFIYLCQHLASHGVAAVTVDENFLNSGFFLGEMPVRAIVLLEHIKQFHIWNNNENHPLYDTIDVDNIMLIGHSRGGEAIVHASYFNNINELFPFQGITDYEVKFDGKSYNSVNGNNYYYGPYHFNIKAIVSIAPTVGQYYPVDPDSPVYTFDPLLRDNFFIIQGSIDADQTDFPGEITYNNAQPKWIKSLFYIYNANHNYFNQNWDDELKRQNDEILSRNNQEIITKAYVNTIAKALLQNKFEYEYVLKNYDKAFIWFPDEIEYDYEYQIYNKYYNQDDFSQNNQEDDDENEQDQIQDPENDLNNTFSDAIELNINKSYDYTIESKGDLDFYKVKKDNLSYYENLIIKTEAEMRIGITLFDELNNNNLKNGIAFGNYGTTNIDENYDYYYKNVLKMDSDFESLKTITGFYYILIRAYYTKDIGEYSLDIICE